MSSELTVLDRHIEDKGFMVGESLTLTADDLRNLGVTPRLNVNRVAYWDPVMGAGNALQRIVKKHVLFPVAFTWTMGGTQR